LKAYCDLKSRHHLSAKARIFIDLLVQHSAEQQKLINPYS
jgi:hypothetical protein